ncbi:hypothetical protein FXO37_26173 [Capsicum annuum]|nr:hypothetical protein FXO37_26173 [Capsicum annuum]
MTPQCQKLYNTGLYRTKFLPKRSINLDKVEEKLPSFHARLNQTGWMCFALNPCVANEHWVREFYANLSVASFKNPLMTIKGRQVNFETEQINEVYGILDADMKQFHAKACDPGTWMADILCVGKEVPYATTKKDILMNDFTAEARLWLNIIYSRVSPCTHMTIFIDILERAYLALAEAHRDLSDSHKKIVKREKKRYKFFKKLWKKVKGIFKVLKPNHRLPSPRLNCENESPANWSADDVDGDGAESAGEDSS